MDKINELERRYKNIVDTNNFSDMSEEDLKNVIKELDEIKNEANDVAADLLLGVSRLPNGRFATKNNMEFSIRDISKITTAVDELTDNVYDSIHQASIEKTTRLQNEYDNLLDDALDGIDINNLEEVGTEQLRNITERLEILSSMVTSAKENGQLSDDIYDNSLMNNFADEYIEKINGVVTSLKREDRVKSEQISTRAHEVISVRREKRVIENQIKLLQSQLEVEEERLRNMGPSTEDQLGTLEKNISDLDNQIQVDQLKLSTLTEEEANNLEREINNNIALLTFYKNEKEKLLSMPKTGKDIVKEDISSNSIDDLKWRIEWLNNRLENYNSDEKRLMDEVNILKKGGKLNLIDINSLDEPVINNTETEELTEAPVVTNEENKEKLDEAVLPVIEETIDEQAVSDNNENITTEEAIEELSEPVLPNPSILPSPVNEPIKIETITDPKPSLREKWDGFKPKLKKFWEENKVKALAGLLAMVAVAGLVFIKDCHKTINPNITPPTSIEQVQEDEEKDDELDYGDNQKDTPDSGSGSNNDNDNGNANDKEDVENKEDLQETIYLSTDENTPSQYNQVNPDGSTTVVTAEGSVYNIEADGTTNYVGTATEGFTADIDGDGYSEVTPDSLEFSEPTEETNIEPTGDEQYIDVDDINEKYENENFADIPIELPADFFDELNDENTNIRKR